MLDTVTSEVGAVDAAPTILERIFDDGRLVRDEHQVDGARRMLCGFVEEATKAGVQVDGSAKRALVARMVALDRLISEQVNQVLHNDKFQRLEASWRNLDKLVSDNDLTTCRVRVFNCHRAELERDFRRAPGFDQSVFFKHVYESEYGTLGGSPYTIIVGDMEFGRSPMDIQFLRDVSAVAAMAHAPFVASAAPGLLDIDGFAELDRPIDIAKIFETSEMGGWNALRDSPDSRYLALTAPRTLVRLPWGPDTAPVEAMDFVEDVDGEDHGKYLWGPSSWALAGQIMKSFSASGWPSAIRGLETGGKVEHLPLHTFPSLSGAKITKCPTETTITDRREKELSDQGIMALCHARNTEYAVIFSGSSVNRPQKYVEEEANANARLSASLPYILACARFAHYFKGDHARQDRRLHVPRRGAALPERLDRPVRDLRRLGVACHQGAVSAARGPRGSRDIPGKPGAYNAVAYLRPHFQLEELTASLRLVAELPN